MGLKKGTPPQSYGEKKIEKYEFQNRTPEERHRIAMMGVEARRKKKNEKLKLQKCLRQLLEMKVGNNSKKREVLKEMGFEGEEATNQALLMTVLFKKGLTGDVFAIREIVEMMDKLDLHSSGIVSGGDVIINVQPVKSKVEIQVEDAEREIEEALRYEYDDLDEDDGESW